MIATDTRTQIEVRASNGGLLGIYEPGNGTRYKVLAFPWDSDVSLCALGRVSHGWLVVNCQNCTCYLFSEYGCLSDSYIQEKLGLTASDYPYFGDLVRKVIGRK